MSGPPDFNTRRARWRDQVAMDERLSPGAFRLAYFISDLFNRGSGLAWPSQETLAGATKTTERTVRRQIDELVKARHLVVEGSTRSHRYRPVERDDAGQMWPAWTSETGQECPPEEPQHRTETSGIENKHRTNLSAIEPDTGQECPVIPDTNVRLPFLDNPSEKNDPFEEVTPSIPQSTERRTRRVAQQGEHPRFAEFYALSPKHKNRAKGALAFARVVKAGVDPEFLVDRMRKAAEAFQRAGKHPDYFPNPEAWLNGKRWEDEDDPVTPPRQQSQASFTDQFGSFLAAKRQTAWDSNLASAVDAARRAGRAEYDDEIVELYPERRTA